MPDSYTIQHILRTMHKLFEDFPLTELNYDTPFQCLIAVMMSAQTTDIQVNKVTDVLFKKIKGPADVLEMGEDELGEHIRTLGLWKSKKKNVYATGKILVERSGEMQCDNRSPLAPLEEGGTAEVVFHDSSEVIDRCGYWIPDTIDEMVTLPGVGVKTAKVVLFVLYRQKRVAVDTHVHRVMNRLSVVDTKTPDQTSKLLEEIIPDSYKTIAHHSIIYFGRYLCKARKPECYRCPLKRKCKWYKEQ